MNEYVLNARNLLCPLPVIRTQNRIKTLADGDILKVICTDPGALHDIPAWCRINGHHVVETRQHAREWTIIIKILKAEGMS